MTATAKDPIFGPYNETVDGETGKKYLMVPPDDLLTLKDVIRQAAAVVTEQAARIDQLEALCREAVDTMHKKLTDREKKDFYSRYAAPFGVLAEMAKAITGIRPGPEAPPLRALVPRGDGKGIWIFRTSEELMIAVMEAMYGSVKDARDEEELTVAICKTLLTTERYDFEDGSLEVYNVMPKGRAP